MAGRQQGDLSAIIGKAIEQVGKLLQQRIPESNNAVKPSYMSDEGWS
jgi:hypothetical protein